MNTTQEPKQQTFTLQGIYHIEPMSAADAVANENALLVDIREAEELEVIHFDDTIEFLHMPMMTLVDRFEELPKDRPLIIVCNDGVRSVKAANLLNYQGYSNAVNLDGGIVQWFRDGLPLVLREDYMNDEDGCGGDSNDCGGCGCSCGGH